MSLSEILKKVVSDSGHSRKKVAKAIPVSYSTLTRWLNNHESNDLDIIERVETGIKKLNKKQEGR